MTSVLTLAPPPVATARTLYRAMSPAEGSGPALGDEDLGVRVPTDIRPNAAGEVGSGGRGMSVAPDDPSNLHPHHRPHSLGGTGTKPVWSVMQERVNGDLSFTLTSLSHGVIAPSRTMALSTYIAALGRTQPDWTLHHA